MNVYISLNGLATKGPCPDGFHIPTKDEWNSVKNIMTASGFTTLADYETYLLLPKNGYRKYTNGDIGDVGSYFHYHSSTDSSSTVGYAVSFSGYISGETNYIRVSVGTPKSAGQGIRPFKDIPVTPDSNWTALYSDKIYHNSTEGLISLSSDGNTWITISDKNLGATTVYHSGDTLSESNCGKYYQRGNNYGFPFTGSITTSSSQVYASSYGPWNYYSSSTFIVRSGTPYGWDSSNNKNLRGGEDGNVSAMELKNAYIGGKYMGEYIEYNMNADISGNLYIPTGGYTVSGTVGASYNWKVSVDGGDETTYSGTGSSGSSITLSGYSANSSHIIKILPTTEEYGWARAYCWHSTVGRTYLTQIIYDGSYMGYALSEVNTGDYFRYYQYSGCTGILYAPEENLPNTVTTVGVSFRAFQYYECSNLIESPEECLPDSITTIGANFRQRQYSQCTSLEYVRLWKDLSISGTGYRRNQFYPSGNKIVKVLGDVGPASYDEDTLPNSSTTKVLVPNSYLSNYTGSTKYPRRSITDSKFVGY